MAAPKNIHREMVDAWNTRDFERLRKLYHTEYGYMGGDGKELKGGPDTGISVAKMYADAFPDGRLHIDRVFVHGDTAIAEMTARGTHGGKLLGIAPTNRKVELKICNLIELRDGKIYREHEYMDMLTMLTQLGAYTVPGSTTKAA